MYIVGIEINTARFSAGVKVSSCPNMKSLRAHLAYHQLKLLG